MIEEAIIWSTPEEIEEELDDLRQNHPRWSERIFLHYVADAHLRIDHARRSGRLDLIKQFMTANCFDRLRKALEERGGLLDLKPLDLQGVQIEKVGEEGVNDFIDVRFVSEREKNLLIEHYRFIRSRYEEAAGLEAPGTSTDVCPHCGAKIVLTDEWECEYCGTILAEQSVGWTIEAMMKEGEYAG